MKFQILKDLKMITDIVRSLQAKGLSPRPSTSEYLRPLPVEVGTFLPSLPLSFTDETESSSLLISINQLPVLNDLKTGEKISLKFREESVGGGTWDSRSSPSCLISPREIESDDERSDEASLRSERDEGSDDEQSEKEGSGGVSEQSEEASLRSGDERSGGERSGGERSEEPLFQEIPSLPYFVRKTVRDNFIKIIQHVYLAKSGDHLLVCKSSLEDSFIIYVATSDLEMGEEVGEETGEFTDEPKFPVTIAHDQTLGYQDNIDSLGIRQLVDDINEIVSTDDYCSAQEIVMGVLGISISSKNPSAQRFFSLLCASNPSDDFSVRLDSRSRSRSNSLSRSSRRSASFGSGSVASDSRWSSVSQDENQSAHSSYRYYEQSLSAQSGGEDSALPENDIWLFAQTDSAHEEMSNFTDTLPFNKTSQIYPVIHFDILTTTRIEEIEEAIRKQAIRLERVMILRNSRDLIKEADHNRIHRDRLLNRIRELSLEMLNSANETTGGAKFRVPSVMSDVQIVLSKLRSKMEELMSKLDWELENGLAELYVSSYVELPHLKSLRSSSKWGFSSAMDGVNLRENLEVLQGVKKGVGGFSGELLREKLETRL